MTCPAVYPSRKGRLARRSFARSFRQVWSSGASLTPRMSHPYVGGHCAELDSLGALSIMFSGARCPLIGRDVQADANKKYRGAHGKIGANFRCNKPVTWVILRCRGGSWQPRLRVSCASAHEQIRRLILKALVEEPPDSRYGKPTLEHARNRFLWSPLTKGPRGCRWRRKIAAGFGAGQGAREPCPCPQVTALA